MNCIIPIHGYHYTLIRGSFLTDVKNQRLLSSSIVHSFVSVMLNKLMTTLDTYLSMSAGARTCFCSHAQCVLMTFSRKAFFLLKTTAPVDKTQTLFNRWFRVLFF